MADVTYVISIRDETGSDSERNTIRSAYGNGGVAPASNGESASAKTSKNIVKGFGIVAAKKITNRVVTTYISQVGVRTGNVTRQEQMNYTLNAAERAIGIGAAILGGLATQNYLVALAGIGAAASWGVDIAVAKEQINLERQVENVGISQANIRAGAGGDRYGKANF